MEQLWLGRWIWLWEQLTNWCPPGFYGYNNYYRNNSRRGYAYDNNGRRAGSNSVYNRNVTSRSSAGDKYIQKKCHLPQIERQDLILTLHGRGQVEIIQLDLDHPQIEIQ